MARALLNFYDAVELWVTQLVFPLQVVLAIVIVLPLCFGAAVLLDRLGEVAAARIGARRRGRSG